MVSLEIDGMGHLGSLRVHLFVWTENGQNQCNLDHFLWSQLWGCGTSIGCFVGMLLALAFSLARGLAWATWLAHLFGTVEDGRLCSPTGESCGFGFWNFLCCLLLSFFVKCEPAFMLMPKARSWGTPQLLQLLAHGSWLQCGGTQKRQGYQKCGWQ